MKRIFITYCFIIFPILIFANGVFFSGNSFLQDKRTSYIVFNQDNIPSFQDQITMSFEIQIKEFDTFGYIFSLNDLETNNSYILVFTSSNNSKSCFEFNTEGKYNHVSIELPNDSINHRWIPISLTLNKKEQLIDLSIFGKKSQIKAKLGNQHLIRPNIIFGKQNYTVDLPNFSLRNLKIYNNQHTYFFPFQESNGNIVHNQTGEAMGTINNPTWLINKSYYWKHLFEDKRKGACAINFDNHDIYIISQDSLVQYCLDHNTKDTYPYTNPTPLHINLGRNFYDTETDKIYIYEFYGLPQKETSLACLDLNSKSWEVIDTQQLPTHIHHHNSFYDNDKKKLLLFGGFGNQKYYNTFLSYDLNKKEIDTVNIKNATIDPRFYSGMAQANDSIIYLYGGIGNHSGMQSLGKKYYDDLYKINLHTLNVEKKWDFQHEENKAVGNTMVYSEKEHAIYALKYKEYEEHSRVQLYKIALEDESIEAVGNDIPFLSEAIKTTLFLYHSKLRDQLYCVIHESTDSSDSTRIAAYELAFPPVSLKYISNSVAKDETKLWNIIPFVILVLGVCTAIATYVWRRKKNSTNTKDTVDVEEDAELEEYVPTEQHIQHKNSIYLYGNFTVYNSQGKDITYMFSAKLKYIFIYILTCEAPEGILSSSLNNVFWADKEESKIKNLKGVTINHLRKILSEIEGISLVYRKKYFYLEIQEPCYCDYIQSIRLLKENFDPKLLSILQRGKFIDGINEELFDYTKSRIEDLLLNYLTKELFTDSLDFSKSKAEICQAILSIDSLNETALSMLIKIYEHNRMKAPALEAYSLFTKEYKKVMDKEYPYTLEDLLKKNLASQ